MLTLTLALPTTVTLQAVQDPIAAPPPASLPPAALEAWCAMDGEVGSAPTVLCLDAAAVVLEAVRPHPNPDPNPDPDPDPDPNPSPSPHLDQVGKQVHAATTPQHAADKSAEAASAALRGCGVEAAGLAGGLLEWRPQHPALEIRRAQLLGALTPC